MSGRPLERRAFGRALADFANLQDWIAHSRVEIDQARLLVLRAGRETLLSRSGDGSAT
jgi:acyl-CoA dehydrogenase